MRRYPATEISQEVLDEVMEVNFNGPFILCRDMGRYWIDNKIDGRLINIASLSTFQGGVRMAAYSASKGAVGQLTKSLSNEWAQHKIRVNAIAPGYVESGYFTIHYCIMLMQEKLQIYRHGHEYRHTQLHHGLSRQMYSEHVHMKLQSHYFQSCQSVCLGEIGRYLHQLLFIHRLFSMNFNHHSIYNNRNCCSELPKATMFIAPSTRHRPASQLAKMLR